jgi:hypothetical protein
MAQDQAALQALSDAVKNATADGSNTATKIGELTESIIQNMGLSSDYRIVSGIIKNDGAGWFCLNDGTHKPINVDSVSNTTSSITIDYTSLGATEMVSFLFSPDETYSGDYTMGNSFALDKAVIQIKNLSKTGKALINHTGSGVFTISDPYGSDFSGLSTSYNSSTGLLTINHSYADGTPNLWDMTGNTQIVSGLNAESYTATYVKFYNLDGTQQTLLDPEVNRFLLERQVVVKSLADPNDVNNTLGNFYFLGILKIA